MPKIMVTGLTLVALMLHVVSPADAVEALTSKEFASHCKEYRTNPEGTDGIFCVRYIQGFIDGAVATDERVTINVASEYEEEETFVQRAIRTRLGMQLERHGSSYYAEFCLGAPVPLADVVDHIVTRLEQSNYAVSTELARDFVYEILRDDYPCELDDPSSRQ